MINNVLLNFKQGQLADTRENINLLISKMEEQSGVESKIDDTIQKVIKVNNNTLYKPLYTSAWLDSLTRTLFISFDMNLLSTLSENPESNYRLIPFRFVGTLEIYRYRGEYQEIENHTTDDIVFEYNGTCKCSFEESFLASCDRLEDVDIQISGSLWHGATIVVNHQKVYHAGTGFDTEVNGYYHCDIIDNINMPRLFDFCMFIQDQPEDQQYTFIGKCHLSPVPPIATVSINGAELIPLDILGYRQIDELRICYFED